jgi:hypothetical protein
MRAHAPKLLDMLCGLNLPAHTKIVFTCKPAFYWLESFDAWVLREARTYCDARAGEVRVGGVDDGVVPLARDAHLIEQDVGRFLRAHVPARKPDDSRETWQPGKRLEDA